MAEGDIAQGTTGAVVGNHYASDGGYYGNVIGEFGRWAVMRLGEEPDILASWENPNGWGVSGPMWGLIETATVPPGAPLGEYRAIFNTGELIWNAYFRVVEGISTPPGPGQDCCPGVGAQ